MKENFYDNLISKLPVGYGLHEIVVDNQGKPVDYVFLEVNAAFEHFTGLKAKDIKGKSVLEILPAISNQDFSWIEFYGDIALNDKSKEFTQYSSVLDKTYKVTAYSPKRFQFVTLFYDYTSELEREKVLNNIILKAPLPIMIHAEDGEIIHISETWTKLTGYDHKEIPDIASWAQKAYGIKQQEVVSFIDELYNLNDSQHDGEFEITTKKGTRLLWDFYSTFLGKLSDGRRIAMSVALDITKKNDLKNDLIREKQLQEITLLSVGDGVITTDRNKKITLMNQIAENLTGWKQQDALGKNIDTVFKVYLENTNQKHFNIVDKVLSTGKIQTLENSTMLRSKDGTIRPIADSASPIINYDEDIIGVVIVFRDYTEKYEEQKKIKSLLSELSYTKTLLQASLNSASNLIVISLDKEYKYLFFNETHRKVMHEAYGAEIQIGKRIFDYMTKDEDISYIKEQYDQALNGKTIQVIESLGDKTKYYYEHKINPIFDENGNIFGITVFAENITERITMQKQIQRNEKRYRSLAETITEGVVIHKEDTTIINANTKAAELLGISIDNLHGKKSSNVLFSFITEDLKQMEKEAIPVNIIKKTKKPLKDYLLGISHSNEKIIWVEVNGIPLFDNNGALEEIVISFRDITKERNIKKQLEYSAYNDYLTGLYNRRYYEVELQKLDQKNNYPISIIMADINGLKLINDAFGHTAGDELLVQAAAILKNNIYEKEILARIGGDEFVMLLPNTSSHEADKRIKKIKKEIHKVKIQSIPLSISFGHSTKIKEKEPIQHIFRNAEDIMYREKLLEIPSMRSSAIETILKTLYEKDPRSEEHSRKVSLISERLALALELPLQQVSEVKTAGLLHDIGKIIISSDILLKKGKLLPEEYEIMKTHSEIGFRILNSTQNMRSISNIVLNHHEHWNGKGYPRGIKEEDIPLKSRIITIADAYDAMTSKRYYRKVLSKQEALEEIIRYKNIQFDPLIVDVLEAHFDEIIDNL